MGAVPVGLGARDTLRLEAGMPLYGNELGPDTTPFEAGLGRVVKLAKDGDFVGRAALEKASAEGPRKFLVGLDGSGSWHRAPRLRCLRGRSPNRCCHQRHPVADSRTAHRNGIRDAFRG